jgi:hypothetical protein
MKKNRQTLTVSIGFVQKMAETKGACFTGRKPAPTQAVYAEVYEDS